MATATTTPTPALDPDSAPDPAPDPLAAAVATIGALIDRITALTRQAARLRQELSDLRAEQKLREAHHVLAGLPGRTEAERTAHLVVRLAADGDYRRLQETAQATRQKLVETEASAFAARQQLAVCLTLLRLAVADAEGAGAGAGEGGTA